MLLGAHYRQISILMALMKKTVTSLFEKRHYHISLIKKFSEGLSLIQVGFKFCLNVLLISI